MKVYSINNINNISLFLLFLIITQSCIFCIDVNDQQIEKDSFSEISQEKLIKYVNNANIKIFKVKPLIKFVDENFPMKYVKKFFRNLMDNFESTTLEENKKNMSKNFAKIPTLIKVKTLLICKESTKKEDFLLVPRVYFFELEKYARLLLSQNTDNTFIPTNENGKNLQNIIKTLGKIANSMKGTCKGQEQYVKFITENMNKISAKNLQKLKSYNSKNLKNSNSILDFTENNYKGLLSQLIYALKSHNFEKSGISLAKVLNFISLKS